MAEPEVTVIASRTLASCCIVAIVVVLICSLVIIYAAWMATRRRLRAFDGPRPSFPMGNLPEIMSSSRSRSRSRRSNSSNDIHASVFPYFARWQQAFGKVFVYWLGTEPFLYVADPEFLKSVTGGELGRSWGKPDVFRRDRRPMFGRGLVMAEGDEWARHRHIIAPAFSATNLNDMIGVMAATTSGMLDEWSALVASGTDVIDVERGVVRNAAEIIAKASFGVTPGDEAGARVFEKLQAMQAMLFQSNRRLVGVPMARLLHLRNTYQAWKLGREIDHLLLQIIQQSASGGHLRQDQDQMNQSCRRKKKNDLLSLLLLAGGKKKKKLMTSRQLVDECKTFFFGGHETTALALSWTLLMLAAHPDWQHALREEIRAELGEDDQAIMDAAALGRLTKMGWVMSEVLRLYPPSPNVQRQALLDIQQSIPAGTNMWVDVVAMHHDPALWGHDVHDFRPERFAKDPVQGGCRHRMGYLPFGFGGRICVGRNLTAMEYRVVLSMLLRRFHLSVAPEYRHEPRIMLSLRPSNGIQLRLTPIVSSSSSSSPATSCGARI